MRRPAAVLCVALAFGAAALVSACSDSRHEDTGPPRQPTVQLSGSRLRAEYWDFDGLRVPFAFFDTQRGEECNFEPFRGADGRHYCVPTASSMDYSVVECSEQVDTFGEPVARRYMLHNPTDACVDHEGVFEMKCTLYSDGMCNPYEAASVDLGEFAWAREEVEPASGRIHGVSLVTDDGARVAFGAWDADRKQAVAPSGITGVDQWIPSHFAVPRGFADAGCTRPAAESVKAFCPIDIVDTFYPGSPLAEPGAVVVGTPYWFDPDGTCVAFPMAYERIWVEIGAAVPNTSFEKVGTRELGGRLRLIYLTGTDGAPVIGKDWGTHSVLTHDALGLTFHDVERDEDCSLRVQADGSAFCLPHSTGTAYADAACTQRAVSFDSSTRTPKAFTEETLVGCDRWEQKVWTVEVSLGETGYALNGSNCETSTTPGFEYYAVGKEIPLSEFASAPLVREP